MTDLFQRTEDPTGVFRSLGAKFSKNLEASLTGGEGIAALVGVELKARTFVAVGRVLGRKKDLSATQRELLSVFDELFSDAICSVFLTGCALDRPAQMVLRRVLELGVGIVYLWDLPHRFCGWKDLDQDLSFNEMLDHIGSPEYKAYVFKSTEPEKTRDLLDFNAARRLYRTLSNTVHAKLATFESSVPDRFAYTKNDWLQSLRQITEVEDLLLNLWTGRFPEIAPELSTEMPQLHVAR